MNLKKIIKNQIRKFKEKKFMDKREFKFYPSNTSNLNFLTVDQVNFYNENGYLFPLKAFEAEEAKKYKQYFLEFVECRKKDGHDGYSHQGLDAKYRGLYELMYKEVFKKVAVDLLGPNIVSLGSQLFPKSAGDPLPAPWHQDGSYWAINKTKTITIWLAIDDADVGNGCLMYVPGSHNLGYVKHERNYGGNNVIGLSSQDIYENTVDCILKAGEFSIHSDLLIHGSKPNPSNKRDRYGVGLHYSPADVKTLWNDYSYHIAGRIDGDYWANRAFEGKDHLYNEIFGASTLL